MEEDVALDPENVDLFGANRVMFDAKDFPNLVEEFGFGIGDDEGGGVDGSGAAESGRLRRRFWIKLFRHSASFSGVDDVKRKLLYVNRESE